MMRKTGESSRGVWQSSGQGCRWIGIHSSFTPGEKSILDGLLSPRQSIHKPAPSAEGAHLLLRHVDFHFELDYY
jgi:hypothetical protein